MKREINSSNVSDVTIKGIQNILQKGDVSGYTCELKDVRNPRRKVIRVVSIIFSGNKPLACNNTNSDNNNNIDKLLSPSSVVALVSFRKRFNNLSITDILPICKDTVLFQENIDGGNLILHVKNSCSSANVKDNFLSDSLSFEGSSESLFGLAFSIEEYLEIARKAEILFNDDHWKKYRQRDDIAASPADELAVTDNTVAGRANFSQLKENWLSTQLSMKESEFTEHHKLKIFLGTWNVNGQKPSEPLDKFFLLTDDLYDIIIVGFQELDLTAEALLLGDTSRAAPWERLISNTLARKGDYLLVDTKQLVGIYLLVYIKREHLSFISKIQTGVAAVGILGVMGNKGGVAVRFEFYDTSFCFVNSHLNAHVENVERRNQDYRDICRAIVFVNENQSPFGVFDHDYLFWIGDLNYRLIPTDLDVKNTIKCKDYSTLLAYDQLLLMKKTGEAFEGFFEAPINFDPTYKYDMYSDLYDTSIKKRTPAWCDRILWKTKEFAEVISYNANELFSSDHRPVSGVFVVKAKSIIPQKRSLVYRKLLQQLDMMENELMPDARISSNALHFENVKYAVPVTQSVVIENIGQVVMRFRFVPKPKEKHISKPWIWISPPRGMIIPKEKTTVHITVNVDSQAAQEFNVGKKLEEVLILHLENGRDFFVIINGTYLVSSFGSPLSYLVRFPNPVRNSKPLHPSRSMEYLSIPKELWRIIDFLYNHGMDKEKLFLEAGQQDMATITECLDTGEPFEKHKFSVHSMAEVLFKFLEGLAQPVIPFCRFKECVEASHSSSACNNIVRRLDPVHYRTFVYLISFLREVLRHSEKNKLTGKKLAFIFSSVILRPSTQQTITTDPYIQQKADFLLNFLTNDDLIQVPYDLSLEVNNWD